MDSPPILLIGNPENRRVTFFQESLTRLGLPRAQVVSYRSILEGEVDLESFITPQTLVRIESPGENFLVEKAILALGGLKTAQSLADDRGRIYHPGTWFQGFTLLMEKLLKETPGVQWFNHPQDIVTMFNKPLCKLSLPHTLPTYPVFHSAESFFHFVKSQDQKRFFIKLNSSSSASGVMAYEYHPSRGLHRAYSSMEVVQSPLGEPRFYNSLKIRVYTDPAPIKTCLDFLFQAGALVEPWIPKATHEGHSYDLRILAIKGERRHAVARLSRSPMTNLHLGNQRCPVEDLNLTQGQWNRIDTLVEDVMRQFPRSLYGGLDVLIPQGGGAPYLLEINAFGDLIPNLLHRDEDTYSAEITSALKRQESAHV